MTLSFRRQLLLPLLIALAGFVLASVIDISDLPRQPFYEPFTYTLLAIGLYGSVYGIRLEELKNHNRIIIQAVTVGVLLKTLIIGGILYLATRQPAAFLLALTVAQIDPLAVANLLTGDRSYLSDRARTILSAWSSFDDPMTVLLSIYALYFFIPHAASENLLGVLSPFFLSLAQNLFFAALAFWLSRQVKQNVILLTLLLVACFVIAVTFKWMLGIALIGLFLRPNIKRLPDLISAAFYIAILLLGFLLVNGINWLSGLILALAAMLAQVIVGFLLTRGLTRVERFYLAFAQQNGITAMILALLFETQLQETVSIVAPAILFINLGYYIINRMLQKL
jgi:NhaP-type Na+/H+ or K+/H+ antiporter